MKKKALTNLVKTLILFFSATMIYAQTNSEQLIKEANTYYRKALEAGAGIFAKSDYQKAYDLYKDAEDDVKEKESADKIKEKVTSAIVLFKMSTEQANSLNNSFTKLMKTRQLVLNINRGDNFPEIWDDAEKEFANAVEDFNDKDMDGFNKYSELAEKLYKDAELLAIKDNYLSKLHSSITAAEDNKLEKFAPITFKKCKQYAQEVENILSVNRYDTLNAKSIAMQALYELNHGIYLQSIFIKMDDEDKTLEDLVLSWEEPLAKIANEYKLIATFDNGPNDIASKIIKNINDDKSKLADTKKENQKLNSVIEEQNATIADSKKINQELSSQIAELKTSFETLTKTHEEAQTRLSVLEGENVQYKTESEELERNQKLIASVSTMFLPSEAEVLQSGDLIIVRLVNLNFPPNKSSLDPQYFSLLMKVQKAIKTFPNSTAVIEGHTDSQGNYQKNLELSQSRSNAIYQYLLTTMEADANRISAIGLGSSKPIANNNSEEGKAKNRRIEIVINPNFSSVK